MNYRAAVLLLFLLAPSAAWALSLFPQRNPVERVSLALPGARPAELILEQWRPYGLAGVSVSGLELRGGFGDLSFEVIAGSQIWGRLRAESLELGLGLGDGSRRIGLAFQVERIAGSPPTAALSLLLGRGDLFACGLRIGLWASERGERDPGAALCALALGPLTLQLLLRAATGEVGAEGIGIRWRGGELELGLLLAGGAEAATWQELSLLWRRGHLGLEFKTRLHPRLGQSRGVALHVW